MVLHTVTVAAQDSNVTVPDIVGQNAPQAAALLNRNGLNLGTQTPAQDTAGLPPNHVVTQSVPAGASVPSGTTVDVTLVLPANVRLLYDDNDITLMNLAGEPMNTGGLVFTSVEGTPATFAASQWGGSLEGHNCFQLWTVSRNGPKSVDDCQQIQNWRSTGSKDTHFWTQTNGVTRFAVQENGIQRATCEAAPATSQNSPLTCEFYLAGGGAAAEVTPFVYFAYTPDVIAFINPTDDQWMITNQTTLYNYNPSISIPGVPLTFGDPSLLNEQYRVGLGDITRLAPGQCIMLTIQETGATQPPLPCDVIAQRPLGQSVAFWIADFEVGSITDGKRHKCPAATPGDLVQCIMPR
jgi:hypothetical protein